MGLSGFPAHQMERPMPGYTFRSRSWVRPHPRPRGVVEFYGGEAVGLTPHLSYGAFLDHIYESGYTVIAVPVPIGPDHEELAHTLLWERELIRAWLGYDPDALPQFWIGHSIGGQFIALLALMTDPLTNTITLPGHQPLRGVLHEPMLFVAPYIGDLDAPSWAGWLIRALGLEFRPSMKELEARIGGQSATTFALSAMLSFAADEIAGSLRACREQPGPACDLSVPWFARTLTLTFSELPGDHLAPMGTRIGDEVFRLSMSDFREPYPRPLDSEAVRLLGLLAQRRETLLAAAPVAGVAT